MRKLNIVKIASYALIISALGWAAYATQVDKELAIWCLAWSGWQILIVVLCKVHNTEKNI